MNYETRLDRPDAPEEDAFGDDLETGGARQKRRRTIVLAALAVFLVIIAAIMVNSGEEEAAFGTQEGSIATVTVISPGSSTLAGIINATGSLAPRRELPVGVVGEGGRVISVSVEAGEWVAAGQVLAVIDRSVQSQQAESAQAQIQVARADAELAQANLDRALKLVERGFISQADIDRLTATRDAAVARVRVAQAQYGERQARNAQLNIVAPAAGLVLERNVEPGQVVGAGSGVLFSIARGGEMELLAQVGEEDLARIPVGASGTVTPVGSDRTFSCQVWQKAPVISEQTRQGVARCAMSYDPALLPGGFASIALDSGSVVAPELPESAIMSDEAGSYVYIVDADNRVRRRDVRLGQIGEDGIAVAEGLAGSERIVLRAGGFLSEGEEVRPVRPE